ncbi:MAG TPA: cupin domain-containing protein [Candidatus Krumholzibacteria bacterium]|nr:cupin domain-containing protein [Candidatus Krumholzibacteria bacterium]HPD70939.1 cupin domain-containing protein [Candidatus Krumholzibacteria bacterium]HRY39361.1 cupin domain-containing protein [Candidatus Krumholzibacteria bacterium]
MKAARTSQFSGLLPDEVLTLPRVEVPIDGVTGFALNDDEKQVVFFVFEEGVSFPDHSHCAQRGTVISGEMVMEIEGRTNLYLPGDHYHVPEGVRHRTVFSKRTVVVDMSDDPARYPVRT